MSGPAWEVWMCQDSTLLGEVNFSHCPLEGWKLGTMKGNFLDRSSLLKCSVVL